MRLRRRALRYGDQPATFDAGDEEERAADERMAAACLEVGGMRPERGKDGVRGLERVGAEFGDAEIGGAAGRPRCRR